MVLAMVILWVLLLGLKDTLERLVHEDPELRL